MRAFDAVGGALAGREPVSGRSRLAGVVSGQPARRHHAAAGQCDLALTGAKQASSMPAAGPSESWSATSRRHLNGIAEIRTFFRTNSQPIYFIGPTAFNLLGIDRWVRNFQYIAYDDSWDGRHPRVFTPENRPYVEFESSEQINNYLLRDPEVREHLASARRHARWWRWSSSTRRPRRSAGSRATR